ncbi:MAG TPA: phage baseplate assembly protein V [Propionicimonas sp.]|nr:phage baseplate assembly protein V [Propionicimonas sp.]
MNVVHSQISGLMLGLVADVDDPLGQGRIRVRFPSLGSDALSNWAPIAAAMAGNDRGTWFPPRVDDEAVVAFDRGDPSWPIVLGFLWNGADAAPSTSVQERMIRSFNGHTIRLLDSTPTSGGNAGGIAIEDASGNSIVLTNGKVTVHSVGVLELDAATIVLTSSGVRRIVTPNANPI